MNWRQIQDKLQAAAKHIRQSKILDAATAALLEEIPVVGGFLCRSWDSLSADEESPEKMASFIDAIAEQEKTFNNLRQLVEAQGEQLIGQGRQLGEILVSVVDTSDDVKVIKQQIFRLVETLRIPSAKAAFEVAAAMGEDYRQSSDRIRQAEMVLSQAGAEAEAHSYYQLGMVYLSMGDFEHAEASLLKAVDMEPNLADGLIGLAMIYQRRATEHLREDNYGLAEDAVMKSEGYVKSAMIHDPTDMGIQVHLGYLYKDLAQCYAGTAKVVKAQKAADKAWKCFETALKIKPKNASAHNGLGSLCIIKGDYSGAIEHCGKAVELMPSNLFAQYDLALAYCAQAMGIQEKRERTETMLKGVEAYQKVLELDGTPGQDSLPPQARQRIHEMYQQAMAQLSGPVLPSHFSSGSIYFMPSSALTPDLQRNIERAISTFSEYLQAIGAASVTPVGIKITHNLRKNQGTIACYRIDGTTHFVEVDAQFADEQDLVLRPYMHHVLNHILEEGDRTRKVPSSLDLLESGLAAYFPCSFKGNPHFAPSVPRSEYWNLKNDNKITDLDLAGPYAKFREAIPIWGGVFWELRDTIGQDTADKLLLKTWVVLVSRNDLAREKLASQFASALLDIDTKDEAGQNSAQIKRILTNRGFQR